MDDTHLTDTPLSVAEAADQWEKSKAELGEATLALESAEARRKRAHAAERAAYAAFNAAVDAMRPKKPRKAKTEGGAA